MNKKLIIAGLVLISSANAMRAEDQARLPEVRNVTQQPIEENLAARIVNPNIRIESAESSPKLIVIPQDKAVKEFIFPTVKITGAFVNQNWTITGTFSKSIEEHDYITTITVTSLGKGPLEISATMQQTYLGSEEQNRTYLRYQAGRWKGYWVNERDEYHLIYDEITRRFSVILTDPNGNEYSTSTTRNFVLNPFAKLTPQAASSSS